MTLDKLFRTTAWTEATLAESVGVHQPTINRLRKKRRTASPQLALAIEKATKGVVKRTDVPLIPANRKLLKQIKGAA